MTTKKLFESRKKELKDWQYGTVYKLYDREEECEVLASDVDRYFDEAFLKELEASIRKEVYAEILEFLKEPEEYCLQHYGYATDKQEDEIYTQGMRDFKAYKIIKLLNRIKE